MSATGTPLLVSTTTVGTITIVDIDIATERHIFAPSLNMNVIDVTTSAIAPETITGITITETITLIEVALVRAITISIIDTETTDKTVDLTGPIEMTETREIDQVTIHAKEIVDQTESSLSRRNQHNPGARALGLFTRCRHNDSP